MPRRDARGKSLYAVRGRLAASGREAVLEEGGLLSAFTSEAIETIVREHPSPPISCARVLGDPAPTPVMPAFTDVDSPPSLPGSTRQGDFEGDDEVMNPSF